MPTNPGTPDDPPPPPTGPPMPEVVAYMTAWRDSIPATNEWRAVFDAIIGAMTSGGGT